MKAAVVRRYGSIRNMEIQTWPDPVPGPGEVLVAVRAVGLNFADIMSRLGVYPKTPPVPFVPGLECAGDVVAAGEGVKRLKIGDRVLGFTGFGSHAELACLREDLATVLPTAMPWTDAAALMVTYLTAYHALSHLANCHPGERVLIHSAAGGVGTAAIQLGRYFNLDMIGTAGSDAKCEVVKNLGADMAIHYGKERFDREIRERFGPACLDIVLDGVGGWAFRPGWKLLAPMGRYVLFGLSSVTGRGGLNRLRALAQMVKMPYLHPFPMVSGNRGIMGFNLSLLLSRRDLLEAAMRKILKLYESEILCPVVGQTYPFSEICRAHEALQGRETIGKVVVLIE
ncbi:MAG TPA: zinc-binding dehydrogenase [Thermoanaerobaculia bacterium]|nr:zinc-binding dehydrogenase [Thermoanaerobaculia bacterium]HUM31166.1 zinc-binding dehydrogenase [Thermoanaerobaculia bacterium]HXK69534.1 zinc-binding dehydrogenase [Thermoanaerobaculia bacterium]